MTMIKTKTNAEEGGGGSSSTLGWTATAFRLALLIASVVVAAFSGRVRGRLIYRGGDNNNGGGGDGGGAPPLFEEAWGDDIENRDNDDGNRIDGDEGMPHIV